MNDPINAASSAQTLTQEDLGELRRRYVTIQHSQVVACGHHFDNTRQPARNCYSCWEVYFKTSVDLEKIHRTLTEDGPAFVRKVYGDKFVKMFRRFVDKELNVPKEGQGTRDTYGETAEFRGEIQGSSIPR